MVPSYRRSADLLRCLEALTQQSRPADQIVVAVRDSDLETIQALEAREDKTHPIEIALVYEPGGIAAYNMGLAKATGDIVAFTDDDARPRPQWLAKIEEHFLSNPKLGAVGGRDYTHYGDTTMEGAALSVGVQKMFGHFDGNHHIGVGPPRFVDTLKGVNAAFRRSAIQDQTFDVRLKGAGAQTHLDMAFCLALRRKGFLILYDPEVAVDHYPGVRHDEDSRTFKYHPVALYNEAHNETLTLMEHLKFPENIGYLLRAFLIGNRATVGIAQAIRYAANPGEALARLGSTWSGRIAGLKTYFQTRKHNQIASHRPTCT